MPEENRVYFWMSMTMDDFMVVYPIAKRIGLTPQQFIMTALQTHLAKMQEEAEQLGKVRKLPVGSPGPNPGGREPETNPEEEKGKKGGD